jgi:hypothetical protein
MITSCETPRSVDITLRFLSTIKDTQLPVGLLEGCGVWSMMWSRFLELQSHNLQCDLTVSLYARAFLTLEKLGYSGKDCRNTSLTDPSFLR